MDDTDYSDDDQSLLDEVLNSLYDFGDGVASERKTKKKKKRKRLLEAEEVVEEEVCGDPEDSKTEHLAVEHSQKTPVTVHQEPPRIQISNVEVVTFKDPTKTRMVQQKPPSELKTDPKVKEKEESNKADPEELTLEKARLEVHRFGIRGYKKEKQRSFEQERAIMLGAKPPKRQYVNYKTLQQELQEKKKMAKEEAEPNQNQKKKNAKSGDNKKNNKKKKATTSTPSVFGSSAGPASMGRFKGGMLVLSSKEIEKINGPR